MGPSTSALSHQHYAMTVGAESYTLHTILWNFFPQKFPSSHFPLSTSHHFHFPVDIPSELSPWHHSPCSKTEPGLRSESVFEEQHLIEALNQPESSPASSPLRRRVYTSLSLSQLQYYILGAVNLSLALSIFDVPDLVWVFCWMWKGGFWFKVLILVVACETCWLNSSHMDF